MKTKKVLLSIMEASPISPPNVENKNWPSLAFYKGVSIASAFRMPFLTSALKPQSVAQIACHTDCWRATRERNLINGWVCLSFISFLTI